LEESSAVGRAEAHMSFDEATLIGYAGTAVGELARMLIDPVVIHGSGLKFEYL
jgi:hypothetical protein